MSYAIKVSNLSKQYTIGEYQGRYKSLRDSLSLAVLAPLRRLGAGRNGGKAENTVWALKDVSFEVRHGEVMGIIGSNGAGKSTLLKILARITEPTEGEVRVRGRVGSLLEVGTGFHPELTGRENIFLNGAILGMSRKEIQRKFDEIVDFAEIEQFIDTPAKHYSSGMYMRLAFAVAAHLEPEILLVDEVLAVGDVGFQKKCLGKMNEVASEGRTVIFVSHNMAAVRSLCSRTLLVEKGKVVFDGTPLSTINIYTNTKTPNETEELINRNDRSGTGEAHFQSIRLLDKNRNDVDYIRMGDDLIVEVTLKVYKPIQLPVLGILIKDMYGATVLRAYSWESSDKTPQIRNDCSFSCDFKKLPLMYGRYSIALWISQLSAKIDYLDNTKSFVIERNDVYKTGRYPDSNNGGICFTEHDWDFNF